MKKYVAIFLLVLLCFSMTSCQISELVYYSISGEILDPVEGFSRSDEGNGFIYKGNKYILVNEINGDCDIVLPDEYIRLGGRCNWPFFPNYYYYARDDESPDYLLGGLGRGSFVYLREDLYKNGIIYTIADGSIDFEQYSAFIPADKIADRQDAIERCDKSARISFHIKNLPEITATKTIYLIDGDWYTADAGGVYRLSSEFVAELESFGILNY